MKAVSDGNVFCSDECANGYTIGSGQTLGSELQAINDVKHYSDLCILSYHLYAQTTKWRIDPFTEAIGNDDYRKKLFAVLREQAFSYGSPTGKDPYGGRASLDPIAFQYDAVDPRASTYYNGGPGEHIYFQAPKFAARIENTYHCAKENSYAIIPTQQYNSVSCGATAGDIDLYCFEGESGISARKETEGGQRSLFGYIMHDKSAKKLSIVFRGSRSGSAGRGGKEGYLDGRGNADWVTDMESAGSFWLGEDGMTATRFITGDASITYAGVKDTKVGYGFAKTLISCTDSITAILEHIFQKESNGGDINAVGITGHSLGGALATLCKIMLKRGEYRTKLKAAMTKSGVHTSKIDTLMGVFGSAMCYTFGAPETVWIDFDDRKDNLRSEIQRYLLDQDVITKGNGALSFGLVKHAGQGHSSPNLGQKGAIDLGGAHMPANIRNSHYIIRTCALEGMLRERGLYLKENSLQRAMNLENLWIQESSLAELIRKKPQARMAYLSAFRMDHYFMLVSKLIKVYLWWFHGHNTYLGSPVEWRKENNDKFQGFLKYIDDNSTITKHTYALRVLAFIYGRLTKWSFMYSNDVEAAAKTTRVYSAKKQHYCPFIRDPKKWYREISTMQAQLQKYLDGWCQDATTVIKYVNNTLKDLVYCLKDESNTHLQGLLTDSMMMPPKAATPTAASAGGSASSSSNTH